MQCVSKRNHKKRDIKEYNIVTSKAQMTEQKTPLGSNTKYPSSQSPRAFYKPLYDMLDHAQNLLTTEEHRIRICGVYRLPQTENITITRNTDTKRASFGGLTNCGDVWACPVCSRKISEERRAELQTAVETAKKRGMAVLMLTLTASHKITDKLADNREFIQKSWSRLTSGRWWHEMRDYFGIVGHVRSLEITHGDNGWHVHIHALIFTDSHDVDTALFESYCKSRWTGIVSRLGGYATKANGAKLSTHENRIAEYISKFGHMPNEQNGDHLSELKAGWNESHEIAKQVSKVAKSDTGRTPFQLLKDGSLGDKQSDALYCEYIRALKGARQLCWSNGLKKLLLNEEGKSDDELANTDELETVATIDIRTYHTICRLNVRGHILDLAANGHDIQLNDLLKYLEQWTWHTSQRKT